MSVPESSQRSGFTAVELAIAMAILTLLLAGVVTIQQRSVALFEQTLANDRVDAATSRTIARLTAELSSAGSGPTPRRTGEATASTSRA